MREPQRENSKAARRLSARLRAISCACLSVALALLLGVGLYSASPISFTGAPGSPASQSSATAEAESIESADAQASTDVEAPIAEQTAYAAAPQDSYASNELLVSVSSEDDISSVARALEQLENVSSASVDSSDAAFGFVTVSYSGAASSGQVADQLTAQGIDAQPNFLYYALEIDDDAEEATLGATADEDVSSDVDAPLVAQAASVDDPMAGEQWGLSAVKAYDAWGLVKCRADNAATSPVVVALIDSGCRVTHDDLKDNIVGCYDTRSGGTKGSDVADEQNHGTHVAGIVAAKANNGKGVAGVSYNAGLYIVRALHRQSDGSFVAESSDVIKAYRNITDNQSVNGGKSGRIRVVNMSLGSKRTGDLGENDKAVMRAIEDAYLNHDLLTVSAAGNRDGTLPYKCYPCDFSDNMIGVINLEQNVNGHIVRHNDSNYNVGLMQTKQLSAPGTLITSTTNQTDSSYGTKSGTSMASPMVAGVAALVFAANPQLTAGSVKNILCSSAIDMNAAGFDDMTGFGRVNAFDAVQLAGGREYISGPDSVYEGKSIMLSCPNASNWKSSNERVATINTMSGQVMAVSAGYTTITAQSNGKTLQKSIAVYDGEIMGPGTFTSGETAQYRVNSVMPGSWSFELESNGAGATITKDGSITAAHGGQVKIVAKLDANPSVKIDRTVQIAQGAIPEPPEDTTPQTMHRLYNPNSGEHFYTADANERDAVAAAGWSYEGIGWTAPKTSSQPVYRLYNPIAGDHHYTMESRERNTLISLGWNDEGIGWYSADGGARVPLYRQYNPNARTGTHNYTTDVSEHWTLVGLGWNDEGIGWYGL